MDKKVFSDLPGTYLAIFLILVALGSLFVFVINWEDWFSGIKLDGWPAGIYLFSKAVVAALLAYLLLKCGTRQFLWSIVSVFFFLFVFILPVFSTQRNLRSGLGWTVFWIELVILIIIPVIFLVISFAVNRMNGKRCD